MANEQQEQQEQNPRDEDRESTQQPIPGVSKDDTTLTQENRDGGGQGNRKQNQSGSQQRGAGSPGTKEDEMEDDNSDDRKDAGNRDGVMPTSVGNPGNDPGQGRS